MFLENSSFYIFRDCNSQSSKPAAPLGEGVPLGMGFDGSSSLPRRLEWHRAGRFGLLTEQQRELAELLLEPVPLLGPLPELGVAVLRLRLSRPQTDLLLGVVELSLEVRVDTHRLAELCDPLQLRRGHPHADVILRGLWAGPDEDRIRGHALRTGRRVLDLALGVRRGHRGRSRSGRSRVRLLLSRSTAGHLQNGAQERRQDHLLPIH